MKAGALVDVNSGWEAEQNDKKARRCKYDIQHLNFPCLAAIRGPLLRVCALISLATYLVNRRILLRRRKSSSGSRLLLSFIGSVVFSFLGRVGAPGPLPTP
jgi:hypothetical protein